MKFKVLKKQNVIDYCMVCGIKNNFGLKANFYELENKEVVSIFQARREHQSYPGQIHGGIVAAILDETIGRVILVDTPEIWALTVNISIKYHKPIPVGVELKVFGRIDRHKRQFYEGSGELVLQDGTIGATATGTYIKIPVSQVQNMGKDMNLAVMGWKLYPSEADPEYIESNHH
jgi:uncharacterized protein (TIGR00369 family)